MIRKRIELLILLVLIAIFFGYGFVPAWRSLNTDFVNYYLAAKLHRQGDSLARLQDLIWFQRQKDHAGIEQRVVSFLALTTYSAMPIMPLASFPPLTAKRYWLIINLLLLGASCYVLSRMTEL